MDWINEPIFQRNRIAVSFLSVVVISLLWLLGVVSIIFAGPSIMACYYVTVKVLRKGVNKLLPEYWNYFKNNIKIGVPVGLTFYFIFALLIVFLRFSSVMGETNLFWRIMYFIYLLLLVLSVFISTFAFPTFSRFKLNYKEGFKWSISLTLTNLFPALTGFLVIILGTLICYYLQGCILFMPGLCLLISSYLTEPVLKEHTSADERNLWDKK